MENKSRSGHHKYILAIEYDQHPTIAGGKFIETHFSICGPSYSLAYPDP